MLCLIVFAVMALLLIILVVLFHVYLCRRLPPDNSDSNYYDENGNHVYYDRKLIAVLEKTVEKETVEKGKNRQ